jgi:hypothetical protein
VRFTPTTQNLLIPIEPGARLITAIARCKANKPFVRKIATDRYTVTGSDRRTLYTVQVVFLPNGLTLAKCNCKAGINGQLCYHSIAAATLADALRPITATEKAQRERAQAPMRKPQPKRTPNNYVDGFDV